MVSKNPPATAHACSQCGQPATAQRAHGPRIPALCIPCAAVEAVTMPVRREKTSQLPDKYLHGPTGPFIRNETSGGKVWNHQAVALHELEAGNNVVLATTTASGKSLVFQTKALDIACRDEWSTALVLYPIKALANDQHKRWLQAAKLCGLDASAVGRIDGDTPMHDRLNSLDNAAIMLMTPDVCHAWLLRTATERIQESYLSRLRLIVVDEAHIYESVFGTNSAYLLRRLLAAATAAGGAKPTYIAATATISEPGQHMKALTGEDFVAVTEEANGAPKHPTTVNHIAASGERTSDEMQTADLINTILEADQQAQLIAFHDSRQGAERIIQAVNRPEEVLPYRAGYLAQDRRNIETKLRNGQIRAIVATSAMELGIDIPDLNYGIQLGLPASRKQTRQRLGRIGRTGAATFVLLAPHDQFSQYNDSLKGYLEAGMEPNVIYLDNQQIALQQARCLIEEQDHRMENIRELPGRCTWPPGFENRLRKAADEADGLNPGQPGRPSGSPHLAHSLRNTGEETLDILEDRGTEEKSRLGTITVSQAMLEAYPGGVYNHYGKAYRVARWNRTRETHQGTITVTRIDGRPPRTYPMTRDLIIVKDPSVHDNGTTRHGKSRGGYALLDLEIRQSVEGYRIQGSEPCWYEDLVKQDQTKSRKERTYPTEGLIITIDEGWQQGIFGGGAPHAQALAEALQRHLTYRKSIARSEVGYACENIFFESEKGICLAENTFAIYDQNYGGLAMVRDLFEKLPDYSRTLLQAARNRDFITRGQLNSQLAGMFDEWLSTNAEWNPPKAGKENWWLVLCPGTPVEYGNRSAKNTQGTTVKPKWAKGISYELNNGTEGGPSKHWTNLSSLTTPSVQLWEPANDRFLKLV